MFCRLSLRVGYCAAEAKGRSYPRRYFLRPRKIHILLIQGGGILSSFWNSARLRLPLRAAGL